MEILVFVIFFLSIYFYEIYLDSPSLEYIFFKYIDLIYLDSFFRYKILFFAFLLILLSFVDFYIRSFKKKYKRIIIILSLLSIFIYGFLNFLERLFHTSITFELILYTFQNIFILLPSIYVLKDGNFFYIFTSLFFMIFYLIFKDWNHRFINYILFFFGVFIISFVSVVFFINFRNHQYYHNPIEAKSVSLEDKIDLNDFYVKNFPIDFYFKKQWGFSLKGDRLNIVIFLLESVRQDSFDYNKSKFFNHFSENNLFIDNFFIPVPHSSNTHFTILTGFYALQKIHYMYRKNFQELDKIYKKSMIYHLQKNNYKTFYITSNDTSFENENIFLNSLNLSIIEKKDLQKFGLKEFEWGIDDTSLLLKTKELLVEIQKTPFFIIYVFSNTHTPYFNPYPEKYNIYNNQDRKNRYLNTIHFTIDTIDEIIEEYKKHNLYSNTLFILLSDHGESFGEYDFILHDFSLYNQEILVPFVMHNERLRHLYKSKTIFYANLLDLAPTLLDILEISSEVHYPGQSIFKPDYRSILFLSSWDGKRKGLIKNYKKWIWDSNKNKKMILDLKDNVLAEELLIAKDYEFISNWNWKY